jgi:hypothetical protein
MKPKEADVRAQRLKGLLPKMTDEQVLYWASKFERFDPAPADAAIARYAEENDELNTPRLLSLLREETLRGLPTPDPAKEVDEVEKSWASVRSSIDAMNDAELEAQRVAVLESLPEFTRSQLTASDPRKSPTLMTLIVQRASGGNAGLSKGTP